MKVFGCFPACFWQVHEEVVAAVLRRLSWHFSVEGGDEGKCLSHEREDVGRREIATHKKVVACETSHWPPIDYAAFPYRVVSQESSGQMLYAMESRGREGWLAVRLFHAYVECCDGLAANDVGAADVDASEEAKVVDCERWYLVHIAVKWCLPTSNNECRQMCKLFYLDTKVHKKFGITISKWL